MTKYSKYFPRRTEFLKPKIVTFPTRPQNLTSVVTHIQILYYSTLIQTNISLFQSFCESQRFPLDILKVGLSPEIPIEIDQNVKIQKTPWLILLIEVSFKASPPHRRETNQDCTIIWYKKSMLVFEMTKYSEYLGTNSNHRSLLGLTVIHDYPSVRL